VLRLIGPPGTGKKTVARALSHSLGRRLFIVYSSSLLASDLTQDRLVQLAFREALLQDAVLCWDNFHFLLTDDSHQRTVLAAIVQGLAERPSLTILAGETPWRSDEGLEETTLLTVQLPPPEYPERRRLWESYLNGHQGHLAGEDLALIASKFRFSGGQIRRVVATARDLALWRSQDRGGITSDDLHAASRWHSGQRLALLAQKIQPRYSWEDIVLPPDQRTQLQEICGYFIHGPLVYEQWGVPAQEQPGERIKRSFSLAPRALARPCLPKSWPGNWAWTSTKSAFPR
jgi:hypothetical protein